MGEGGGTAHFRVQSIVRVSRQHLPSKAFLKRLGWFLFGARPLMLGQGKPQESIGWLPAPSRPASCSRGGGVLERTTHCCVAPTQGRAFGEEHCFEGGKAWLTNHFEEATGLECFHQMMHVGGAIPIPSGGPIRPGPVGKRFT
ncbi:hypothetical protein CsSME_00021453 [Camellia sinensis var. sinensis]|uniref:Uncharacterized protein n=1 Tax=Camellia sinensis TaxID=4442 RepID=A0A7J7G409_CAMSI|nr:hypothetical protein HYC85_026164 [Camellia sinensis]